jgi:hypothetical protein
MHLYNIYFKGQSITLKHFIFIIIALAVLGSLYYIIFKILYYFLSNKLNNEGFLPISDETGEVESEYILSVLRKQYNFILNNYVSLFIILFLIFFMFPTTIVDYPEVTKDSGKEDKWYGKGVIASVKQKFGDKWFKQLAYDRKKYIEKHGYEKYIKMFGEQLGHLEPAFRDYELRQELNRLEHEKIIKEKNKILFSDYDLFSDTFLSDTK